MIKITEGEGFTGGSKIEVTELHYLALKASYRMSATALNRLAEILLGRERAAEDWTFDELYSAATDAKIDEWERKQ